MSLSSEVEDGALGICPSLTPSRMTYFAFSRHARSMLPQVTRSSETGMVPTSYSPSTSRNSCANRSAVSGVSPHTHANCSIAETRISHSWRYSSASCKRPAASCAAARADMRPGASTASRNTYSARTQSDADFSPFSASRRAENGAIARARSSLSSVSWARERSSNGRP